MARRLLPDPNRVADADPPLDGHGLIPAHPALGEFAVVAIIAQLPATLQCDWTTDRFCQTARLSPSHLRRLFCKLTGRTPMRYLKSVRLEAAARLLETSHLSIKEISVTVGYQDLSHFVRDFRECFGQRPTAYRAASRGITPMQPDECHGQ